MNFPAFMDLLFIGLTFSLAGKVLLGITVINVHAHIVKEHRIDRDVLTYMKKERVYGMLGVLFIFIGYLFELAHFGYLF